jgi:hypothetical protein
VTTKARTDWVSPAREIAGRDHLGVQAVSEHLYADLLPGITNVTSRIRCYSFYPWFVRAFDERVPKKNVNELVRLFRRAECLHTLIGVYHELEEGESAPHGQSLVGRRTLANVAQEMFEGKTIRLSDYADVDADGDHRYFKNELGGLGQYYLGPLRDLYVLDGDGTLGLKYTAEWGKNLAELHDATVDADLFFDVVRGNRVNAGALKALRAFCPCHLRKNKGERDALVDLMFCRGEGDLRQERGSARRDTLLLLLDFSSHLEETEYGVDLQSLLESCYSGVLPDGKPWVPAPPLAATLNAWAVYQKHELLSVAVQGLFWAGLQTLLDEEKAYSASPTSYAQWFAKRFETALARSERTLLLPAIVAKRAAALPPHQKADADGHELALAHALFAARKMEDVEKGVKAAVDILLALLARGRPEPAYGTASVTPRFFQTYEINLESLQQLAAGAWSQLNGREWIQQLAAYWGLRVHFRVALRKLRYQTQDSFRIVPLEDGLHVREAPPPQWSAPRLAQALTFLSDLGALDLEASEEGEYYKITPFGRNLLESNLGAR